MISLRYIAEQLAKDLAVTALIRTVLYSPCAFALYILLEGAR